MPILLCVFKLVPVCRVNVERPLLEASDFISSYKLLHATDSKAAMLHGRTLRMLPQQSFYVMGNVTKKFRSR
jgi:hypothetical protein